MRGKFLVVSFSRHLIFTSFPLDPQTTLSRARLPSGAGNFFTLPDRRPLADLRARPAHTSGPGTVRLPDAHLLVLAIVADCVFYLFLRRKIAFAHSGYRRQRLGDDRATVGAIMKDARATLAVVGMPKAPSGLECDDLRSFVDVYTHAVFEESDVEAVGFVGEFFTTMEAVGQVQLGTKRSLRRNRGQRKVAIDSVCY